MARHARSHRRLSHQLRSTPYSIPCCWQIPGKEDAPDKASLPLQKRDWEDATCSVCMEFPHNAVLLLCSSYDKGCRPYMCGTSYRHSNCLDQFKKAYTKVMPTDQEYVAESQSLGLPLLSTNEKSEVTELACPLCRGQVKGWTVVEPARDYLNNKKRSCMQDDCLFTGTYKELRKHVRAMHPSAKPWEVDPALEQKWRTLEHEREREDVISTIRSSMPRSVVFGDYVIEMGNNTDLDTDEEFGDRDLTRAGRGISRSILYLFLHEGARLARLHRDDGTSESTEGVADGHFPSIDFIDSAGSRDSFFLDGDDDHDVGLSLSQARGMSMLRSQRRRRRRRRRSQGGSASDAS